MHAPPQFLLDLQKLRPHADPPGPPLEEETPPSGFPADEGEPQKVEGLRFTEPALGPSIYRGLPPVTIDDRDWWLLDQFSFNTAVCCLTERTRCATDSRTGENETGDGVVFAFARVFTANNHPGMVKKRCQMPATSSLCRSISVGAVMLPGLRRSRHPPDTQGRRWCYRRSVVVGAGVR